MGHYAKRFFGDGIVKDSLKLWYNMGNSNSYPGTGTTVYDLSASVYNGTLSNSVVYNSLGGGSVYFNNNGFVDCTSNFNFERTQAFSIGVWTYSDVSNNTTNTIIFDNITSSTNRGFGLFYASSKYKFVLRNTVTTNTVDVLTTSNSIHGSWTYIIVTYNGNSLASGVNIYVNGVLQSKTTNYDNLTATIVPSPINKLVYGRRQDLSAKGYIGYMNDFTVYNKELTAEEVNKNYQTTRSKYGI